MVRPAFTSEAVGTDGGGGGGYKNNPLDIAIGAAEAFNISWQQAVEEKSGSFQG
jgi:hypothetical protein